MEVMNSPTLSDVSVDHLREYILDMVQELATVAARRGDVMSARALQSCWAKIYEEDDR
jgi:hypothetical protein